jgi:hypothetical protein
MTLRFPFGALNFLSGLSLSQRRLMLARFYAVRKSSKVRLQSGSANFKLLMLISKRDLLAAQVSLASIKKYAQEMPKLVIACDSSLSAKEAAQALTVTPDDVRFLTAEEVANFFEKTNRKNLAWLCRSHVFGYKLAACIMQSLDSRVLYADTDILWHADPALLMDKCGAEFPLFACIDYQPSYDLDLIGLLKEPFHKTLDTDPYINAGLAVFNSPLADNEFLSQVLSSIPQHFKMGHFTEQTILALMAKEFGKIISGNDVAVVQADKFNGATPRANFASHFVTPVREYFWHEAARIL